MDKYNFVFILLCAVYFITSTVNGQGCKKITELSGEIHDGGSGTYTKCWHIEVPEDSRVRLDFLELSFGNAHCFYAFVKVLVNGENEAYTFCRQNTDKKPIIASNDVIITYHQETRYYSSSFRIRFTKENLICAQKNHFRCSPNFCVYDYQVCNGVKDCENGADEDGCEIHLLPVNVSRTNAINWLKNQRTKSFGWGKNTHRAITALYLSKEMTFQTDGIEENLIAKQLELQTYVALLRNTSDPISINELSMFVNALFVTCYNPRNFYGYDLVQILSDRVAAARSPVPGAYLTLCNLNWPLSDSDVQSLMKLIHKDSKYMFHLDVRALTVMALKCIRNTMKHFTNIAYAESVYMSPVENFVGQLPDGSFGNIYTTALVVQALLSSGQGQSKEWSATAAEQYLIKQLNSSSIDLLSVYLTLPIFSGTSLIDLKAVDCSRKARKEGKDKEISELKAKLGGKMQIQYSLYIGDGKDIVYNIYLRMPEKSSAYDVMRVAQIADSKYKFLQRKISGQMYVYSIADIANDSEAGKFWLLYTGDHYVNGTVEHHTDSPDKFILKNNDHLIMWYRTAYI